MRTSQDLSRGWLHGDRGVRLAIDRQRLREARLDRGMTQQEVANAIGITVANLCKIENGQARQVYARNVELLEDLFGIDLDGEPADPYRRQEYRNAGNVAKYIRRSDLIRNG